MKKALTYQEDITIINVHVLNNRAKEYMKQSLQN